MDLGLVRGLITAVLMALFIALVVWAFSRKRKPDFDEASNLPLADERTPRASGDNREQS